MIKEVESWCLRHGLLRQSSKILIACSGGPDSLALTDVLLRLRRKYKLELAAAHFNHMFRGSAADDDADFVEEFCAAHGLVCYQGKADVPKYIAQNRLSPEEGARLLRYAFLRRTAAEFGGAKIAVAHHRDDQAETVLLHLLRGAGSGGLGGMKAKNNDVIRPFLNISRHDIEVYCRERGLTPRFDKTNEEIQYLRNRIRLNILPELERTVNPAVKTALCRSAELISAEHDFIHQTAVEHFDKLAVFTGQGLILPRQGFQALPVALQRELLMVAIEKKSGQLKGIGFLHIEKMIELTKSGTVGSHLELPGGLYFYCHYDNMSLLAEKPKSEEKNSMAACELKIGGRTGVSKFQVDTELLTKCGANDDFDSMVFDYDRLKPPLYLRYRQPGDVFQPLGMRGTKKLKDFFIDIKLPREQRDTIPLICDSEKIIWLVGIRQSEQARIGKHTRRFLRINIQTKDD